MSANTARIALATQGTRGDFQPVLALGIGLARAGHTIIFYGNPDHAKTAREFNFDAVAVSVEVKDLLATERGRKAMEAGDLVAISTAEKFDDDIVVENDGTDWQGIMNASLDAFRPDAIIYTGLITGMVFSWPGSRTIPCILATYQPHAIATNSLGPIPMQRLETEPEMPLFYRWVMTAQFDAADRATRGEKMKAEGIEQPLDDTYAAVWENCFEVDKAPVPIICAYSREWWPAPDDWPKTNVEITGNWKIRKEEQEERAAKGGAFFDAGGQHEACMRFIESGSTPVYVGWGSMLVYSKGHMARLAVGALKEAGQRGIVVGGWAELSVESLDGAEDSAELKEYAAENVLFLKAAPHEWLFPQCACAVHHGGIGTTQASLSAGVPTIITPVFADQRDIADKVHRDRHGVGTVHLSKVTAKELGAAIRLCCTDETIKSNVKDLAARMQKEDGVAATVQLVEKFIFDDVKNGKWQQRVKEREERIRAKLEKTKRFPIEQVFANWQMELMEKYPVMKAYMELQMSQMMTCITLMKQKKLWVVCAENGCLAREGEGLKTPEVGRFKEFAILEELALKGNRVHVKRIKGIGPNSGWVSTTVSGKDMIKRIENNAELKKVQMEAVNKPFQDLNIGVVKNMGMA